MAPCAMPKITRDAVLHREGHDVTGRPGFSCHYQWDEQSANKTGTERQAATTYFSMGLGSYHSFLSSRRALNPPYPPATPKGIHSAQMLQHLAILTAGTTQQKDTKGPLMS